MLFSEEEKRINELKRSKKYWRKQYKDNKSKYSQSYCLRMIEEIEKSLKNFT